MLLDPNNPVSAKRLDSLHRKLGALSKELPQASEDRAAVIKEEIQISEREIIQLNRARRISVERQLSPRVKGLLGESVDGMKKFARNIRLFTAPFVGFQVWNAYKNGYKPMIEERIHAKEQDAEAEAEARAAGMHNLSAQ
jgi:hypothetical protein